jgi:hypothetical protein
VGGKGGGGEGGKGGGGGLSGQVYKTIVFHSFDETMLNRVMLFIAFKVPESRKIK